MCLKCSAFLSTLCFQLQGRKTLTSLTTQLQESKSGPTDPVLVLSQELWKWVPKMKYSTFQCNKLYLFTERRLERNFWICVQQLKYMLKLSFRRLLGFRVWTTECPLCIPLAREGEKGTGESIDENYTTSSIKKIYKKCAHIFSIICLRSMLVNRWDSESLRPFCSICCYQLASAIESSAALSICATRK